MLYGTVFSVWRGHDGCVPKKKVRKLPAKAERANVRREMDMPRMSKSAREQVDVLDAARIAERKRLKR